MDRDDILYRVALGEPVSFAEWHYLDTGKTLSESEAKALNSAVVSGALNPNRQFDN